MTTRITVPDEPIPGRYAVAGFIGKRRKELYRFNSRSTAERYAHRVLLEGALDGRKFTAVEVFDRINSVVVYQESAAVKRYG